MVVILTTLQTFLLNTKNVKLTVGLQKKKIVVDYQFFAIFFLTIRSQSAYGVRCVSHCASAVLFHAA